MRKNLFMVCVAFGLLWASACVLEAPEPGFDDETLQLSESKADGELEAEALPGPCDISRTCSAGHVISCHGEGYCRVGGKDQSAYVECDGERTYCLVITPE